MERQVLNAEHFARSCKRGADTLRLVRENGAARSRLLFGYLPCLGRVFETSVVARLPKGVLCIPNQTCMMVGVIVAPAQLADFRFATGRVNGEPHDVGHRNFGTLITPIEILGELIQLLRVGTNLPSRRATDQLHLIAGHSRLIDDRWVDIGASTAVFGGAKNAADPRQIIAGSWAGRTMSAPRAYVINEHGRIQGCCTDFSNVMPLEILERGLFSATPGGECTERVDVPTDQHCERGAAGGRCANGCNRVIERVLAILCPALGIRARIKGLDLAITLCSVQAAPDDCLIAGAFGTDSLAYGCHCVPPNNRSFRAQRQVVKSAPASRVSVHRSQEPAEEFIMRYAPQRQLEGY